MDRAAELFEQTCRHHVLDPRGLVLHADNGGPMKGSTMLATLQRLGVVASFSRPRVSDDNPFSEALFRTLKYRPEYPCEPFATLEAANVWVEGFVSWYKWESRCFTASPRYVVDSIRSSCRGSGPAGGSWPLSRASRRRRKVGSSRSARLKTHGPCRSGCKAWISPCSTTRRKVLAATPRWAAACVRFIHPALRWVSGEYTGILRLVRSDVTAILLQRFP